MKMLHNKPWTTSTSEATKAHSTTPASPLNPLRHASANLTAAYACRWFVLVRFILPSNYSPKFSTQYVNDVAFWAISGLPLTVLQSQPQLLPATNENNFSLLTHVYVFSNYMQIEHCQADVLSLAAKFTQYMIPSCNIKSKQIDWLTSTTSVPPFWMRFVRNSTSLGVKAEGGLTWDRKGILPVTSQGQIFLLLCL